MHLISEMRHIHDIQARLASGDITASPRLDVPTLAYLEHPADPAARDRFRQWLVMAISTGEFGPPKDEFTPLPITETVEVKPPPTRYPPMYSALPHRQATVIRPVKVPTVARQDYRQWRDQCPASLLSDTTRITRWIPPAKPKTPRPPPVPARDIKTRLLAGESIEAIHTATGASKHTIRQVKATAKIPDCPPGPRGKSG